MGSSVNFTLSKGTATRCSPTPRKPPTPSTTALISPFLSASRSLIDPRLSLLSLYTLKPTIFDVRQLPFNDEVSAGATVVALSVFAESVVADGLCANATLASSAEPARPAMVYLANISVLPQFRNVLGKPVTSTSVPPISSGTIGTKQSCHARLRCNLHLRQNGRPRSEAAQVRGHAVIAMQLFFLGAIAPVEILVGPERRRALQFFIVDVEFVGFEPGVVAKPSPRQRNQVGADAQKPPE